MAIKEQQIFKRAEATLAVMTTLRDGPSAYQWGEVGVTDFEREFEGARALQIAEANKKAAFEQQRGLVNSRFDTLEARTIQGIGMATHRFRNSPEKLQLVQSVHDYGVNREAILRECDEWAAVWSSIEPSWEPTAQNTLANFTALCSDARAQLEILGATRNESRQAGIELSIALAEMEDLCVRWYTNGTETFTIGTTEGDLIRSQIPTFDSGGK